MLCSDSPYFKALVIHGTVEATTRVVHKPDSDATTVDAVVQLITKSACALEPCAISAFHKALDQILIANAVISSLPARKSQLLVRPIDQVDDALAGKMQATKSFARWKLTVARQSKDVDWIALLRCGVLLSTDGLWYASLGRKHESDSFSFGMLGSSSNDCFLAESAMAVSESVECFLQVRNFQLMGMTKKKQFVEEELSLRLTGGFMAKQVVRLVQSQVGIRGYVHDKNSLGYYLDGGGGHGCPTFFGSAAQLLRALEVASSMMPLDCQSAARAGPDHRFSIRVAAPSQDILRKLIAGIGCLKDHPNTFGMDVAANAFFVVKTVPDMRSVLRFMSLTDGAQELLHAVISPQTSLEDASTLETVTHLIELTYPKGVF